MFFICFPVFGLGFGVGHRKALSKCELWKPDIAGKMRAQQPLRLVLTVLENVEYGIKFSVSF